MRLKLLKCFFPLRSYSQYSVPVIAEFIGFNKLGTSFSIVLQTLKNKHMKTLETLKRKNKEAQDTLTYLQKTFVIAPEKKNVGSRDRILSSAVGLLLAYAGVKNFRKGGYTLMLPAGYLLWRAVSGYCYLYDAAGIDTTEGAKPFEFSKSVTIQRSREEVYKFWRQLENLPQIMTHLARVEKISDNKYRWEAEFNKQHFAWNALIVEDIPNEKISWASIDSPDVENAGIVEFKDAPKGGTELKVTISYKPGKTKLDSLLAQVFNPVFKQKVLGDLMEFKRNVEIGEIILII